MKQPFGVILAGGLSSRMGGGDKGLLDLSGKPILTHVVDRLRPQVDDLALNANGDPGRFSHLGMPIVPDSVREYPGPLAGVLAGMDWAAEQGAETIVTAAADTPFFPCDLVPRLLMAADGMDRPLALAATRDAETGRLWRQPTFGLWPVALRDDLRAALRDGLRKVVLWTDRHDARTAVFPTDMGDPFFNVNTPDELDAARAMVQE